MMNNEPIELQVTFDDDNQVFSEGLWQLLKDIFNQQQGKVLNRNYALPMDSALQFSDIYVSSFNAGEELICRPQMKLRKAKSLLIAVCNGLNEPKIKNLPHCLRGCVFVRRTESIESIRDKIEHAWAFLNNKNYVAETEEKMCLSCFPVRLTDVEERVVTYFYRGFSLAQIANIRGMHVKTVSAHKRAVMNKLNLSSSAELIHIMHNWAPNIAQKDLHIMDFRKKKLPIRKKEVQPNSRLHTARDIENVVEKSAPIKIAKQNKKETVFNILKEMCHPHSSTKGNKNEVLPLSVTEWPKTRDIADECDDSVYVARYWLTLLEKEGRVRRVWARGVRWGV